MYNTACRTQPAVLKTVYNNVKNAIIKMNNTACCGSMHCLKLCEIVGNTQRGGAEAACVMQC